MVECNLPCVCLSVIYSYIGYAPGLARPLSTPHPSFSSCPYLPINWFYKTLIEILHIKTQISYFELKWVVVYIGSNELLNIPKPGGKGQFSLCIVFHLIFRPNLRPIFSTSKAQLNFCCPSDHLSGAVGKKGCNAFSKPLGKCASTQRQPSLNALGIASITNIKLNLLDFNHVHPNI